ncbi:tetratricopeptide repeat protein [Flavivirga abyssicola]|uniref:tetratricopeptide repeat protein n=1 Tax=Flavivirga abyssicola TaxID=3063533 RepID=UPI0026E0DB97|nr:tetratricopeptide repeat protein [Flavivirga sp. MEBiC07777]WVK13388.1 tetratricopeptide repeat protein [Flavivirga sp. MEBiC07777]
MIFFKLTYILTISIFVGIGNNTMSGNLVGKPNIFKKSDKDVFSSMSGRFSSQKLSLKESEIVSNNESIKLLIEKAANYSKKNDFEESNNLLLKAIELIKKDGGILDLGYCYNKMGTNYYDSNDEKKALEYYSLAELTYEKTDSITPSKIYNLTHLSSLYTLRSRFTESQKRLNKALNYAQKTGKKKSLAVVYNIFSEVYLMQGDIEKSIDYLKEIEKLYSDDKQNRIITIAKVNMLSTYIEFGQYEKADSLLKNLPDNLKTPEELYYVNFCNSAIFLDKKEYSKALSYNSKALAIAKNNTPFIIAANFQRANIFESKGDIFKAIEILEQSMSSINEFQRISHKGATLFTLAEFYKKIGKHVKSNELLHDYIANEDSIRKIEEFNNSEFLKTMFNVEKTEFDLEKKERELNYLSEKNRTRTIYNTILLICLILLIILSISIFIKRNKLHLSEKKIQKIENDKLQQSLDFKNRQITNFSIHIKEKNKLLEKIKKKISDLGKKEPNLKKSLSEISLNINEDIKYNKSKIELYSKIQENNNKFLDNLNQRFPHLSVKEQEIVQFLRLNLSSKQIASQLNLSIYSIDTYRSRIRSKMRVDKKQKLSDFIKEI